MHGTGSIAAGGTHACAVTNDGTVWCWGFNGFGQLGDGTNTERYTPVRVVGLPGDTCMIAAGTSHTCALGEDGAVFCWGANSVGQLGDGTTEQRSIPVRVIGLPTTIRAVAAGRSHTCALTEGGTVWCWGRNEKGQLGDRKTADRASPVRVVGLPGHIRTIASGGDHTCALTDDGDVWCWGRNDEGQLGDGTTVQHRIPVHVRRLPRDIRAIAVGSKHTCALTADGEIYSWGWNDNLQLGDGQIKRFWAREPVPVAKPPTGIRAIAAGGAHTCALTDDGALWCWGWKIAERSGAWSTTIQPMPTPVVGLPSNICAITAGTAYSCALTDEGTLWCWGHNGWGQLGDGTTTDRAAPVRVVGLSAIRTPQ